MPAPTIQQVFGDGATQDATSLIVAKADLGSVGLTGSATNTAQSLLAATLLKAKAVLTPENFAINPDQRVVIEESFETLVERNDEQYRQKSYTVTLYKLESTATIDPDDY
ncbi:MAG: hypothetical protein WBB28_24970 [Crinalium sp.]